MNAEDRPGNDQPVPKGRPERTHGAPEATRESQPMLIVEEPLDPQEKGVTGPTRCKPRNNRPRPKDRPERTNETLEATHRHATE